MLEHIRNFCIIAHIDHGKSTLADRILELTGAIPKEEHIEQYLDSHFIERERGITIKAKAVTLSYRFNNSSYILNLIDTPGHVDFSYEVSKSLSACEGAILLVDATQGIQAQTIANFNLAFENNLTIIPVINKIDLSIALIEETRREIEKVFGFCSDEIFKISAKTGENVEQLLEAVIRKIPPPKPPDTQNLQAMIFDSFYDTYRGVVMYIRLFSGEIKSGDKIYLFNANKTFIVEEVGIFTPRKKSVEKLSCGEVGYIIAGIRNMKDVKIGDTIMFEDKKTAPISGYREPKHFVFCSFYPVGNTEFTTLQKALTKLNLTDAAFIYHEERSEALGPGFRCGFLGLLHSEIVSERLEREENVEFIRTIPNVTYEVTYKTKDGLLTEVIDNPAKFPPDECIEEIKEPIVKLVVIFPIKYIEALSNFIKGRRGTILKIDYITHERVLSEWEIPFSEILYDFYDKIKSLSHGYATMDYEHTGFKKGVLTKLKILIAGKEVDAFTMIVPKENAYTIGRKVLAKLRKAIPRQLFEVALQASVGGKIIARETIPAIYKFVTGKCYGGDITRKKKLWEKQKAGKKKLKSIGQINIPQEAFLSVLKLEDETS
ncbi:MAG: translation elongation factor 4 [Planctomycetota bacterium]